MYCNRKYTPKPKKQGYPESVRKRAMEMCVDGGNLRRIARHLKVAPQTVSYWVTEVAEALPTNRLFCMGYLFSDDLNQNALLSLAVEFTVARSGGRWVGAECAAD